MPKKSYDSVVEMVRDTARSPSLAAELKTRLASRRIVKQLQIARCLLALSQTDVAQRMKCSRSKVAKIEASQDADLRVGDLIRYAEAVNLDPAHLIGEKTTDRPASAKRSPRKAAKSAG